MVCRFPRVCALLLCLGASLPATAEDWTVVPLGTTETIYGISNSYLGNHWVVGANGFVARSNADRTQWTTLDPGTDADFYSVTEPTGSEVWMGGGVGVVRLNLYASWLIRDLPSQLDFHLFTRRGGQCAAVGPGGLMYRWLQGVWSEVATGVTVDLNDGAGIPTGPAWVVGDEGTILRTEDGDTWIQVASGTTADLHAVVELDLMNLYAVGEAGTILRSTDAGANWSARPSGTTNTLRAVSISKDDHAILLAAGLGGTILRSTDAGDTWCPLDVTTVDLHAAEAYTDLEFLVAGAGGLLLRSTNGGGTCQTTGVDAAGPRALTMGRPFPQPSSGLVSLRIGIDRDSTFRLEVYDLAGRRVRTLPDWQAASAGDHQLAFDASGLSSGVYFVRLRGDGVDATRRFVIMR